MTVPPTAPDTSRPSRILRAVILTLAALALWLVLIDLPDPPGDYLDASWQTVLVDAHAHGRSFGNGVIFSAGPLGFLNSHFFLPGSLPLKYAWEFGGKLLLAVLLVVLSAPLAPVRRTLLLLTVTFLNVVFADSLISLVLALAALQWLVPVDAPRRRAALALVLLTFFAQLKFTFCLLVLGCVALAVLARLARRDFRGAVLVGAGFGVAFLAWWLAAGQNPVRLYDYLRYSWQFSSGYAWAMSLDESWPVFAIGALTALACGACVWRIWRAASTSERLAAAPVPLVLAAVWFLSWKHGFTRADGHVLGFFLIALWLALALPAFVPATAWRRWFDAIVVLGLAGLWLAEPVITLDVPRTVVSRIRTSIYYLSQPSRIGKNFDAGLARDRAARALPEVRAAIGAGSVDMLGYEQGLLLLNDLNYQPRPVFQGYAAYTDALMQKNAGYFRGAKAPEFVVVRIGSIDERHPMEDDALVHAELPLRYEPVLDKDDTLVFRRKAQPAIAGEFARAPVQNDTVYPGQSVSVPPVRDHPLWLQVRPSLSWLGQLRGALYKPPRLFLVATDSHGDETRHRIVPSITGTGFMISPVIQDARDYVEFARGHGRKFLKSLRIEPASPDEAEFWSSFNVRFSVMSDLPLKEVDPMQSLLDAQITNVSPISVSSEAVRVQDFMLRPHQAALIVHAPGEMTFQPPAEMRRLTGEFGFVEAAYTTGQTDGAEFVIEADIPGAGKTVLWRRALDPRGVASDRGIHPFEIALPAGVSRLTLRTLPGKRNEWDWTYWSALRFAP